jgi:catechol 2,3-dioxygenase-like lactoylglutathione lyase family enzyme
MHIGHVAMQVPDLGASAEHAKQALGLIEIEGGEGAAYLSTGLKHHEVQLIAAEAAGLDHIGFEVTDEDELAALRDRAIAAGARILSEDPEEPGLEAAVRLVGPGGVVFELYTPMAVSPPGIEQQIGRHAKRFGHVTLVSEVGRDLVRFATEGLGFRVSDEFADFTWMRCDANHHSLAVGSLPDNKMHHYAFELNGWGGMMSYLDDIALRGESINYGPGRHGPGYNIFTYLPDPAGALLEAYTDLQMIYDDATYEPMDWSKTPGALNLWGPDMPANFGEFGIPILAPGEGDSR